MAIKKPLRSRFWKALFTGTIVIIFSGIFFKLLEFFYQIGKWAVPGSLVEYVSCAPLRMILFFCLGLGIAAATGTLIHILTHVQKVRAWLTSDNPRASLLKRMAGSFFAGEFNYFDYLDKPEIVWELSQGVRCFGLLSREEGDHVVAADLTMGVSPGNGKMWLIEKGAFQYTGRTGADLYPELIKMALGEGNKPIRLSSFPPDGTL